MTTALAMHWPEYLIEAWALGTFMVCACLFAALLELPGSPVRRALPGATARRALMGLAMALTAAALIYSPWGGRSGAHMNPAVTLTFWHLGKVAGWDALFYVVAQFVGGAAGVALSAALVRGVAHPSVGHVVTTPGPRGATIAFLAEVAISMGLMLAVLAVSSSRHAMLTGLVAALLVFLYITFEAPLSGMSMNPARTVASAIVAGRWRHAWLYLVAPVLGMLLAAETFAVAGGGARHCAKLHHVLPCIFCHGTPAAAPTR